MERTVESWEATVEQMESTIRKLRAVAREASRRAEGNPSILKCAYDLDKLLNGLTPEDRGEDWQSELES